VQPALASESFVTRRKWLALTRHPNLQVDSLYLKNGTVKVRVNEFEGTLPRLWPDNLTQFEPINTQNIAHGNKPGVESAASPQSTPYTSHGLERRLLAVEIGIHSRRLYFKSAAYQCQTSRSADAVDALICRMLA